MPDPSQFDLDYRPTTYWAGFARATANVKGTTRRKMVGQPDVPAALLAESLDDETRAAVGQLDPAFMGGEYLPDHTDDEVTIARVELASTTGDVIEIRARRTADGVAYRVVDEYESPWSCAPASSAGPLSMGELIRLIDGATDGERSGLTTAMRDYQLEGDVEPEEAADFVTVVSDFYPQLGAWYEAEAVEWLEQRRRERGGTP